MVDRATEATARRAIDPLRGDAVEVPGVVEIDHRVPLRRSLEPPPQLRRKT